MNDQIFDTGIDTKDEALHMAVLHREGRRLKSARDSDGQRVVEGNDVHFTIIGYPGLSDHAVGKVIEIYKRNGTNHSWFIIEDHHTGFKVAREAQQCQRADW